MNDEKMKILSMLENGNISADEAAKLLDAIGAVDESARDVAVEKSKPNRWLRIRIAEDGREKVKVNVPLKIVELLTKMQGVLPADARAQLDEHEIDLEQIVKLIREGAEGEIVSVEDGEDTVKIFVE